MASLDRPRGFHPTGKEDGSPWNSLVRSVGAGTEDLYMFDALVLASGLAEQAATNDTILGVMVGFGWNGTKSGVHGADFGVMFNPDNLNTGAGSRWFDVSAVTNTEWSVHYVPARGSLFEGQQDDGTDLSIGAEYDIVVAVGDATTGISGMEINGDASTNDDVIIIQEVRRPDVASTDANADWVFKFKTPV